MSLVFASADDAKALARAVDIEEGLPRDGVDIGPGRHMPKSETRTLYHAPVLRHPTRPEWAYPIETVRPAAVTKLASLAQKGSAQALDASWDGARGEPMDVAVDLAAEVKGR